MYAEVRDLGAEARAKGLPLVVWSYPRGSGISKAGETAVDVIAYAAHIAAQLGAHIIKVKPPTANIELTRAKKAYESNKIPITTLTDRVRHVVQSAFGGRRIVIFSGGATKSEHELMEETRSLAAGGSFGSIIGRNSFQRAQQDALKLLRDVMDVYLQSSRA
jgi:class I fructose-bisphosphate aldolase